MDKLDLRIIKNIFSNYSQPMDEGNLVIYVGNDLKIGLITKDRGEYGYIPSNDVFRMSIFKPIKDEEIFLDEGRIIVYSIKFGKGYRFSNIYISEHIRLFNIFSRNLLGLSVLKAIKRGLYIGGNDTLLLKKIITPLKWDSFYHVISWYRPVILKDISQRSLPIEFYYVDDEEIIRKLFLKRYGRSLEWLYQAYKVLYQSFKKYRFLKRRTGYGLLRIGDHLEPFIELRDLLPNDDISLEKYDLIAIPSKISINKPPIHPPYIMIDGASQAIEIVFY